MDRNIKRILAFSIVLVAVALVGFAVMSGYQQWAVDHVVTLSQSPTPNDLNFTFTSGGGKIVPGCLATYSYRDINVKIEGNEVLFSGYIVIHGTGYLTATHETKGNEIFIKIKKHFSGVTCDICDREVPFNGKLSGLDEGYYKLIFTITFEGITPERKIVEMEIKIPDYKSYHFFNESDKLRLINTSKIFDAKKINESQIKPEHVEREPPKKAKIMPKISIESLLSENVLFLNNTENRIRALEATYSTPSDNISDIDRLKLSDVDRPKQAVQVPISEDKLRELDKEEELNPKEPYVLALWGGEYKPAPNEKIGPRLEKRIKETKNNTNEITYCYIMISGLILPSKIKELEERGVKVVGWYPPHCIAVKVQLNKIAEIKNLSFVRWIGYGDPMMKLHPALQKALKSENTSKEEKRKIYISLYEEDTSIKEVVIEKGGKQGIRYIGAGKFRDAQR